MTCQKIAIEGGGVAVVCTKARRPRRCCGCGQPAALLCDHLVTGGRKTTCDNPICARCATEYGRDLHRCPSCQLRVQAGAAVPSSATADAPTSPAPWWCNCGALAHARRCPSCGRTAGKADRIAVPRAGGGWASPEPSPRPGKPGRGDTSAQLPLFGGPRE